MNQQQMMAQQRYAQQQAQYGGHGRPAMSGHPQQMAHGQHPGQPAQHLQHMQHMQQQQQQQHHAQHGQHGYQRRPMGQPQQRPRTAQAPIMDPAAHLAELQLRHERSLATARRPTDQVIPKEFEQHVVGDGVKHYTRTREVERQLDALMTRKILGLEQELEVEEETGGSNSLMELPHRRYRTMRIWITNTAENQPWQGGSSLDEDTFDFSSGTEGRYRVKITGKMLEKESTEANGDANAASAADQDDEALFNDPDQEDDEDAIQADQENGTLIPTTLNSKTPSGAQIAKVLERVQKTHTPKKLSQCFERINVDFERSQTLQADTTNHVDWVRPSNSSSAHPSADADFDTLEFERKSDENLHCTINLHRESHGIFELSPPLADLLQIKEASRDDAVQAVWQYIRLSRLPQEEEKGLVQCDEALRRVFGVDVVHLKHRMYEYVSAHLRPLPPHALAYTIRVDADFQSNPEPTIYDIPVPDPLPSQETPVPSLARIALHSLVHSHTAKLTVGAIAQRDNLQATMVAALHASRSRQAFYDSLAADPVAFVNRWVASQQRDLEIILGDARFGNPDLDVPDHERWMADEFRRGGDGGVWGSDGVRESVGLMVREHKG